MSGLARFTGGRAGPEPGGRAGPEPGGRAGPEPASVELPVPLRRFLEPREITAEICEFCGVPVAPGHRHVVDLDQRGMLCACRGCALLFTTQGAAQGRYRAVPERYLRVEPFTLTPRHWASLQIPVGIAFVVRNTQLDQTVAFYPSPGGATESELPLQSWDDIVAANPVLQEVEPDVEATLVRSAGPAPGRPAAGAAQTTCYIVPVDRCYELVGALRLHWRGFDGGQEARRAIEDFFNEVDSRARVAS